MLHFSAKRTAISIRKKKKIPRVRRRVSAVFRWHWSNPKNDGTLENDVIIGDYRRPWNAKPEARILAGGIPNQTFGPTTPTE